MELLLARFFYRPTFIMGNLFVDGTFECFTMELPRAFEGVENVHDKTCIPTGDFPVQVRTSPLHPNGAPHVLNVPGRSAIEMHICNRPKDIKGCIGVGQVSSPFTGEMLASGIAFMRLMDLLRGQDRAHIIVTDDPDVAMTKERAVQA